MVRGTFANVRLRNKLAPGTEGGVTRLLPEGEPMSIFDASVKYAERGTPLVILAGKEYGSGSSRDWAAKGPRLLGVRAVIAESFERIHRSNLVGMGILPLQFEAGQNVESLGLTGEETLRLPRPAKRCSTAKFANGQTLKVRAKDASGKTKEFSAKVRIDTPQEILYFQNGGILQYVLRQLARRSRTHAPKQNGHPRVAISFARSGVRLDGKSLRRQVVRAAFAHPLHDSRQPKSSRRDRRRRQQIVPVKHQRRRITRFKPSHRHADTSSLPAHTAKLLTTKNDVAAATGPATTRVTVICFRSSARPSRITPAYHAHVTR